ncbi:MAG: hypothetical protein PWK00_06450, partial [Coxiella burnetii]|nr:hypothetical protein [Coxiella burnetii]
MEVLKYQVRKKLHNVFIDEIQTIIIHFFFCSRHPLMRERKILLLIGVQWHGSCYQVHPEMVKCKAMLSS